MPLTKAQVQTFLFNWLKTQSGLTTILANQGEERPPRPYASINFLNAGGRLGSSQDQQSINVDKTVSTEGMRKAVASINIFGQNAIDTLAKVRDSLDRPDVIESFGAIGISHVEESPIADLTALQETAYEERGQMDLTVAYVAGSDVDVGTIEHAQINGTVNGRTIPVTVN